MKKFRRIATFILCFVVIAAMSVTAYAIQMKAKGSPRFRDAPSTSGTILAQFDPGDLFQVQSGTYDSSGDLWYKGYPDETSNPYSVCGWRLGYSIASSFDVYNDGY